VPDQPARGARAAALALASSLSDARTLHRMFLGSVAEMTILWAFPSTRHFCSEKRAREKFLSPWRCCDRRACAAGCGNRASIHKIKQKPCYFSLAGVMRMTVQIDSRLHCTDVAIHSC
jgi:hypothetical protein